MLGAVDWGVFWTTAIGAAIGAGAAILGGLIAGWYQLKSGREARQAAREDEAKALRQADLRSLGEVVQKVYGLCGRIHQARSQGDPYVDYVYEHTGLLIRGAQLMSILYDPALTDAYSEFGNVGSGSFTAAVSTQEDRAAALEELGGRAGNIYVRIGDLFQS